MTTTTTEALVPDPSLDPQGMIAVPDALKRFIWDIQSMVELADSEREILVIGRDLMQRLVASSGWLPQVFAKPDTARCQEFQLYRDDLERFTVVSTIFAGSQATPIRQDAVWEITGVLSGPIECTSFALSADGRPEPKDAPRIMQPGAVDTRASKSPDAVQLRNVQDSELAVSIHVYGGDIGQLPRRTFTSEGQVNEAPVSYANPEDAPSYDILTIQTRIID